MYILKDSQLFFFFIHRSVIGICIVGLKTQLMSNNDNTHIN